jgi:hypothetical protein
VRAAGASAAEIKGKQYTSHGAAMFDPSKERYAVFERCLTDARMKTIRREIIDANPRPTRGAKGGAWTKSRWTHVANARGEAPETSRRFQLYCGAALKRAGVAQGVALERVEGERRPTRRERHLLPLPEGREQGEAPRLAHGSRWAKVSRP